VTARVGIGIDTGGTFTDAVVVDLASGELLSKAKAPTTRDDLARGVSEALLALDGSHFDAAEVVALSTTLATNAVVEGKGSRVGLIVAVPDPATFTLPGGLPATDVAVIAGAHQPDGEVRAPLDIAAATAAIARMAPVVDAFAVSAYFSVANAEHENALKALIAERCPAPVVCGHELSQRIGMVERAVTAALNARLLPLVRGLLDAVGSTLTRVGISAPLMVVKGDGSLTAQSVARDRPVETVLSGPAASVVGACRLSGLATALVADMGGTTTDIALVSGGMPEVNPDGALVGGWRTRVRALDVRTVGLGGDSRIAVDAGRELRIGPARAIPIATGAERFPHLLETLRTMRTAEVRKGVGLPEPLFLTLVRRPSHPETEATAALLDALDGRAIAIDEALAIAGPFLDVDALVRAGEVAEIAVTPTDVLVAAGELELGCAEASREAIAVLARLAGEQPAEFATAVREGVTRRLTFELAARALTDDLSGREPSPHEASLLAHLLEPAHGRSLRASLSLDMPLVGVGAPAHAWFPSAGARLGGDLSVPRHAEVANAYGALAGRVFESASARVKALPDETFAVITPEVRECFNDYPTARERAGGLATAGALERAVAAGAPDAHVTLSFDEVVAVQERSADRVIVELTVTATASGAPFL